MAAHGRIGEAHTAYLVRKSKPHKVSGIYVDDAGKIGPIHRGKGKRPGTRKARLIALHRNATGKRGRDYPLYKPYVCAGRDSREVTL